MKALIILAAGESARLGRSKQNLLFACQARLQRAVEIVPDEGCKPVIGVPGAYSYLVTRFDGGSTVYPD